MIARPQAPRNLDTPLAATAEVVSSSGIHGYESTVTRMTSGGNPISIFQSAMLPTDEVFVL